jgi:hypothetical protein
MWSFKYCNHLVINAVVAFEDDVYSLVWENNLDPPASPPCNVFLIQVSTEKIEIKRNQFLMNGSLLLEHTKAVMQNFTTQQTILFMLQNCSNGVSIVFLTHECLG